MFIQFDTSPCQIALPHKVGEVSEIGVIIVAKGIFHTSIQCPIDNERVFRLQITAYKAPCRCSISTFQGVMHSVDFAYKAYAALFPISIDSTNILANLMGTG